MAEQEARDHIDHLLELAGWSVQDYGSENLNASLGVAIREFQLKTGTADYLLFIDRIAVGVIEAKPVGHSLGGVDWQIEKYVKGLPEWVQLQSKDAVNQFSDLSFIRFGVVCGEIDVSQLPDEFRPFTLLQQDRDNPVTFLYTHGYGAHQLISRPFPLFVVRSDDRHER